MRLPNMLYLKCSIAILISFWHLDKTFASRQCPNQDVILPCRCLVRGDEYQIWCTHSDFPSILNGLKSIGEYIKDPIDELILENNYLPSLPGRIFSPINILRLMLRHNGLERVSSDWLTGLESNLVEVFLVEPQFRSIPDDAFSKLNALQAVTIQTKLLKHLPLFSRLMNLRYIQIESESLLELSALNFKDNVNLEKLHMSSSPHLTKLEANTFVDLPKLDLLNITHCGLNWIHPRAFTRLPSLKELSLIGNKLRDAAMIGQATRELPILEVIKLDSNDINKLDEASFVDMPKITEISLSENKITEILFGAFHRLPQLKKLNLNKNFIKYIHPESFLQDMPNRLEELLLVDNRISHIKDIRSVLNSLPRLLFLDLSFNNLQDIPFGGFRGHPTLEQIDLSFNKINLIDKEAFMAMPALRELRLRNNSLSEQIEPPYWNLPALKGLDLSENLFRRVVPSLLLNLPSLRRLDLHGNHLNIIDQDSFLLVPALEHVNISHNQLKVLHPATFRPLLHLYELDASYNWLVRFVPGLPRAVENLYMHHNRIEDVPRLPSPDLDLPVLKILDLRFNRLEMLYKKAFGTMPQLRKILLGSNALHTLDESALYGLDRLEILELKENRLTTLHPFVFKQLKSLNSLDLSNNNIEILTQDLLKGAFSINHLDISQNKISEILPNTFEKNLELQSLDASNNHLVHLPKSLSSLTNLKKLDLAYNRLKFIDKDVLQRLENLRELSLSKNYIHELKTETFTKMQFIKSVNIDNNELIYIEPNSFLLLPSLKSIRVDNNKIIEIPDLAFNRLPSLQILELQGNDIRTIAPTAFNLVPQLLMLNLSNNKIMNVDDAGLRTVSSLEVLDLSSNRISRLSSSAFEKMEWIVELKMDNNNICGVQGLEFVNMPRLRVLSLKNNKMVYFPEESIQRQRSNIAMLDLEGNTFICTCELIWLQVWLQETNQPSPRCSEGGLLSQILLSREDCRNKKNLPITASPGCDTELLTSTKSNMQINNHLQPLRNTTFKENVTKKNSLGLNPQESDYFYDDYVDYHFNESMVEKMLNDIRNKENDRVKLTTSIPHNISGDTPTLYAMPRNKSKSIPPKVPDSPSTSGFSFFGIPLAGFNLDKILQAGVKRLANKTTQPTAERKHAIMSNPEPEILNRFSGNRNRPIPLPRPQQIENNNLYNIRNNYPPSTPQFQSGFVPILPGIGGFKPILNPNLTPQVQNHNSKVLNRKDVVLETKPNIEILHNKSENVDTKPNTTAGQGKQNHLVVTEEPTSESKFKKTINQNITTSLPNNATVKPAAETGQKPDFNNNNYNKVILDVTETTKPNKGTKIFETETLTKSEITILEKSDYRNVSNTVNGPIQNSKKYVTSENRPHNVNRVKDLVETTTKAYTKTTTQSISPIMSTIKVPMPITTETILVTAANEEATQKISISPFKNVQEMQTEKILNSEKPVATPLSSFLAPGSATFPLKNNVKSTITKVPSPYLQEKQFFQPTFDVSEPLPHRDEKNCSFNSEVDMFTVQGNFGNDWYFENYNKTNIEPYIAGISSANSNSINISLALSGVILTLFILKIH